MHSVCDHTLPVITYSSGLTSFLQSLQKDCHSLDLFEFSNFRNASPSGTKTSYKRVRSQNISDKETKRTK